MELKATQRSIAIDCESGKRLVTYEIESGDTPESLDACRNKTLRITVKQWRDKRPLNANSYYWHLVTELSKKMKISTARCHNLTLRNVGIPATIDGRIIYMAVADTDEAAEQALESTTYHMIPTSRIDWNAEGRVRDYMMLKNSHEMDSEEFSLLIDEIVEECKEQGIETLPPDEISHLIAVMEKNNEKHHAI